MDILLQTILPSLFAGLCCLWLGYRLGRGGESVDRRRKFKAMMSNQAELAREQHPIYLSEFYDNIRGSIRSECVAIRADIPWFRKKRFNKLIEQFLNLDEASLHPPQSFTSKNKEENTKAFRKVCEDLFCLMNRISDAS